MSLVKLAAFGEIKSTTPLRRAFTLIELLMVIGIIAVLAGIGMVVFVSARERAWEAWCVGNLRSLHLALDLYRQDWDGIDPTEGQRLPCYEVGFPSYCYTVPALQRYGASRDSMICPADTAIAGKPYWEPYPGEWSGYLSYPSCWVAYRPQYGEIVPPQPPSWFTIIKRGMKHPVFYDHWHAQARGENPPRVTVIRLDGSVQKVSAPPDLRDWEL
ncbi:MAG: type II secretion system GspH family protein [Armatimonadetes bacterium]|nr:type II secretion system GspH family protein [Armatimonadota bacterium]MDW8122120.1 type II secretion system protein [Armatimonadota bacterium]